MCQFQLWFFSDFAGTGRATLALVLMLLQTSRRLYECLFVSTFSRQYIRLWAYFVGHYHYVAAPLIIALQSSAACGDATPEEDFFRSSLDVALCFVALSCFALAWFEQHRMLGLLADLRVRGKGPIVSQIGNSVTMEKINLQLEDVQVNKSCLNRYFRLQLRVSGRFCPCFEENLHLNF